MIYTKREFGLALDKKLKEQPFNIINISRWCNAIYDNHIRELDDEMKNLIFDLSTMADDPQFEYSEDDLKLLAQKLINLELPDHSISEIAQIGDSEWLICPKCIDAWQSKNKENALVQCPKCQTIFNNPRYTQMN